MSEVKRVTKNSVFVFSARIMEAVLNLAVFAVVARYLGVEGFGVYSVVIAVIWVLSPMIFLGLNQILARDVAVNREHAPYAVGNGILLNLLMSVPVFGFAMVIAPLFEMQADSVIALSIAIGTFVLKGFAKNYFGVIIAYERMKFLTVISFVTRLAEVVFIVFVSMFDLGFVNLFIASFTAELLGVTVCMVLFSRKLELPGPRVRLKEIVPLLKECLPVTASLFLMEAFLYVNVFILKMFSTDLDVGLFQGPHKILTRLQMFPMALFVALLPVFSRMAGDAEARDKFDLLFAGTFKWILVVTLPFSLTCILFSDQIIMLLFGGEFLRAGAALRILLLAFPFLCLNVLCRYLFLILKKYRVRVISDSVLVLGNIAVSAALVPSYGFIGACIGTLSAILVQTVLNIFFLSGHFREARLKQTVFAPVFSGILLFSLIFGLDGVDNIVLFPTGILVYILTLFIFKTFSEEDILYMKRMIGIRKGI